jgi:signal transduction histidine kinase
MGSLKGRLSLGLAAALVASLVLMGVAVDAALRHLVEDFVASRVEHDMEGLLARLEVAADGGLALAEGPMNLIYRRPYSGHYFVAAGGPERVRSRSLWDQDLDLPEVATGEVRRLHRPGPEGQRLLLLVGGFEKRGRPITIGVAEDLSPMDAHYRELVLVYLGVSAGFLALLLVLQRYIVVVSLRPLEAARRDVARLEAGEVERLGESVPTEVRPLVQEVNRLLEVMVRRLTRSRNALGDLAHGMKTPLTLLAGLADRRDLAAHPDLAADLRTHTETLRRLIERHLKRARTAGGAAPGAQCDLAEDLPALVAVVQGIYRERALEVDWRVAEGLTCRVDRQDLLELLGNLLDNAGKWAAARVRVAVWARGGALVLSVEDDGPGVPEAELEGLARRGVRADESVPGHGLGLGIVADIAGDYGGRVSLGRSADLGGFRAEVTLPLGVYSASGSDSTG